MKRKIAGLLCSLLALCQIFTMTAYARPDWPSDTGIQAEAGALMDVDSGTLIFGQNSHVEYPPASITKILTALIVLEHVDDLSETVTFSETAMNSVESDSGNKLSLVVGDTMSVEDCLYALLLVSVNQSANALAEHVAGSIPAFVDMMNAKLVELGCTESHFENPSGLNGDTQNVSAYDMAKIACAAYSNEKLLEISSTTSRKLGATTNYPGGYTVQNEHRLVITEDSSSEYYCPEAVAGKTGYLLKAGNTLVTYAEKDGRRLISVILKGSPRQYFVDGKELLNFGFSRFKNVGIAENETRYVTGEETVEIAGVSYSPEELMVEPGKMITLPDSAGFADAELSLEGLPENAPGGAVALLQYIYNERKIGSAYLMTKEGYAAALAAAETAGAGEDPKDDGNSDTAPEGTGETGEAGSSDGKSSPAAGGADGNTPGSGEPENEPGDSSGNGFPIILILAAAMAIGAAAGIGVWISNNNKKEAEAAALRRAERRRRLSEEGAETEAEFNRLLEEKQNRSRKRGR